MSDLGLQPARTAVQPTPLGPSARIDPRIDQRAPDDLHSGRLRIELILFLLLVATFAAILFKDMVVGRRFAISEANIVQFDRSWYADDTVGGKSAIVAVPDDQLRWSCDLRPGFAYPFCGSGISFRKTSSGGDGRDLSRYGKVVLDFDYRGPSTQLKLALKTIDRRRDKMADGNLKPNMVTFTAVQGRNHVELDLANLSVETWWASQQGNTPAAEKPQRDHVVSIDLQTGNGASIGRYDFAVHRIAFIGEAITLEHWYQLLLGCWTGIGALYLVWRLVTLRRIYARRQRALVRKARLLEESRDAAENASRAKSSFLAHMSHELRTPLNAILGYAQILRSIGQTERQVDAARTIQQSGEHLLSLISDILDLSRIEAGRFELEPAAFDLRATVRSAAKMIAVRAQEKNLLFHWTIGSEVPRGVVGDEKCLRQVLINLLGNAVKFTDRGEVRLELTCPSSAGGNVRLRFEVRDTGGGIPADQLDKIFEPFEQVADRTRRTGGTGLGLSISRRIVEQMGGDLKVESTVGAGSRFWFDIMLPLADAGALPPAAEADEPIPARAHRATFDAVPAGPGMDRLHDLAQAGNMRAIRTEAERLIREEARVRPFAEELLTLARSYQSQAILELIEDHKIESVAL
jgi:signal transduction histidine kinase